MPKHPICHVDELPPGGRRIVELDGRSIGVFNVHGSFHAIRNVCPHQLAPLCQGTITGTSIPLARWPRARPVGPRGRVDPLPLARLGVRHRHRAKRLQPPPLPGQELPGEHRAAHRGRHRGRHPPRPAPSAKATPTRRSRPTPSPSKGRRWWSTPDPDEGTPLAVDEATLGPPHPRRRDLVPEVRTWTRLLGSCLRTHSTKRAISG